MKKNNFLELSMESNYEKDIEIFGNNGFCRRFK